jgi:hypothetical protein
MSYFVCDVESDGEIPPLYSMVCFGCVKIDNNLDKIFYGKTKPISDNYKINALQISNISREEHLTFDDPKEVFLNFKDYVLSNTIGHPIFISDNLAYDWSWINWYFHNFLGENPFGFSGKRIGDIYCGMMSDMRVGNEWKKFRQTKHTHNPVMDAKGNAEAILKLQELGLKINLK